MLKAVVMALALVPALANDMDDQEMADFLGVRMLTSNDTVTTAPPAETEVTGKLDVVTAAQISDLCAEGSENTVGCAQAVAIFLNQTAGASVTGFAGNVVTNMDCAAGQTCSATVSFEACGCPAGKTAIDNTCYSMNGVMCQARRRQLEERELAASTTNSMLGNYDVLISVSSVTGSSARSKMSAITTAGSVVENAIKAGIQSSQNETQYDITDEQLTAAFSTIQSLVSDAGAILRYNTSSTWSANVKELAKVASNAATTTASGACTSGAACTDAPGGSSSGGGGTVVGAASALSVASALGLLVISALLK